MLYPPTILFVEDDDEFRGMMSGEFERAGFKVVPCATGGEEAIGMIGEGNYDLVLFDLGLPTISNPYASHADSKKEGFRVLGVVQNMVKIKDKPILVYSNFGEPEDVENSLKLGAKEHLVKSNYTPAEIVQIIKKYLN